jgi:hypothetical protein
MTEPVGSIHPGERFRQLPVWLWRFTGKAGGVTWNHERPDLGTPPTVAAYEKGDACLQRGRSHPQIDAGRAISTEGHDVAALDHFANALWTLDAALDRLKVDRWIEAAHLFSGGQDFGLPDLKSIVEHLPVQVAQFNDIEVDPAKRPDASRCQAENNITA